MGAGLARTHTPVYIYFTDRRGTCFFETTVDSVQTCKYNKIFDMVSTELR